MAVQYAVFNSHGVYGPFATNGSSTTLTTDANAFSKAYGGEVSPLLDPTGPAPVVEQPFDQP
jgi:hypothetical protein